MATERLNEKEVLKELKRWEPVTAADLGRQFNVSGQTVAKYLSALAKRGMAMKIQHGAKYLWIGDDEIARGLVQAYPILIAFYKRRNPRFSEFLEAEWEHLLEKGFAQWEV